jgi:hypothetical protein
MANDFSNAGTVWVGTTTALIRAPFAHDGPNNVSFPAGLFSVAPVVQLTCQMATSADNPVMVNTIRTAAHGGTGGVDATGFSYCVFGENTVSTDLSVTIQITAIAPSA